MSRQFASIMFQTKHFRFVLDVNNGRYYARFVVVVIACTKFRDLLLAAHFSQVLTCRLVNRQLGVSLRIAHADWPVILERVVAFVSS